MKGPFRLPAWMPLAVSVVMPFPAAAEAPYELIVVDDPDEGFNSNAAPDPVSANGGNPGTTLGEQRVWAFEQAARYWAQRLDSSVPIQIRAEMNPKSCDSFSAVLGSAGTYSVFRDWAAGAGSPPPEANTWYSSALADSIAGRDLDAESGTDDADIVSSFNSDIDDNDSCLSGTDWYYGLGAAPSGTISFFRTVLHEIAHGLGFQTFVDLSTGAKLGGYDDAYLHHLEDDSRSLGWSTMDDSGRATSATDEDDLHWVGASVTAVTGDLAAGVTGGEARMYSPSSLEPGSSVSHWDTDYLDNAGYDELMEPVATGNEVVRVTDELFEDIGWNAFDGDCSGTDDLVLMDQVFDYTTTTRTGCMTVTADPNVVIGEAAEVTFRARDGIALGPGFSVEQGSIFRAWIDPLLTLR